MKKTWNETIKLATPVINFLSSVRRRQLLPELAAAFARIGGSFCTAAV